MTKLTTQVEEGPHGRPEDCPTFHDGCHCTVETLIHNMQRAQASEDMLKKCLVQFRMYQASHQAKVDALQEAQKKWPLEHAELEKLEDAATKAAVNKEFADAIEKLLLSETA